jgi:hypothetical protein
LKLGIFQFVDSDCCVFLCHGEYPPQTRILETPSNCQAFLLVWHLNCSETCKNFHVRRQTVDPHFLTPTWGRGAKEQLRLSIYLSFFLLTTYRMNNLPRLRPSFFPPQGWGSWGSNGGQGGGQLYFIYNL